jgi:hypothetical protein
LLALLACHSVAQSGSPASCARWRDQRRNLLPLLFVILAQPESPY